MDERERNEFSPMEEHMSLPSHREISKVLNFCITGQNTPYQQMKQEVTESINKNRVSKNADECPVFSWGCKTEGKPPPFTRGFPVIISKVDEHGAFYQLGWEDPTKNSIALFNPDTGEWDIHPMVSMSHGNIWSVYSFQTISALIARIFEYLGIPVLVYIDDILIFSPPEYAEVHFNFVKKVMTLLGFDLSTKSDGVILGQLGKPTEVLGFEYTATLENGTPKMVVEVGADRLAATRKETINLMQTIRDGKRVMKKMVDRVLGLLSFICYAKEFRQEIPFLALMNRDAKASQLEIDID